ncbi:hypothetical protein DTO212C5_5228 [Paecilomyces variotii]|nr:hypothetical protein DTO212C5_5228 [Paecilomyces variotii]
MPPRLQGPHSRSQQTVETRWNRICNYKNELITHAQCTELGIKVTRLELETSPDPGEGSRLVAGSYFEPLTDDFMLNHPIDEVRLRQDLKEEPRFLVMRDYNPEAAAEEAKDKAFGQKHWGPKQCLSKAVSVLERHIFYVPRVSSQGPVGDSLIDLTGWSSVNDESTLSQAFYLPSRNLRDSAHPVRILLEAEDYLYPHVSIVVQHNTDDIVQDGLILRHELAYILNVMRIRLDEGQFRQTQPHPVLMLSFVAPQHGRILEAYIRDQNKIEVACSRLYSFEQNATAPFELFYRWVLGQPIGLSNR